MGHSNEKTLLGLDRWFVQYDYDSPSDEVRKAIIYKPINGRHNMIVGVAEVDELPCELIDGEMELVREGEEADRLAYVCQIVHVPDMIDCIRRCLRALDSICDGKHPDVPFRWERTREQAESLHRLATTEENHPLWVRLCEIQRELEVINDSIVDLDRV